MRTRRMQITTSLVDQKIARLASDAEERVEEDAEEDAEKQEQNAEEDAHGNADFSLSNFIIKSVVD